jgi:phosphatidylinositol kinase/protein kinase (PI-3  family)
MGIIEYIPNTLSIHSIKKSYKDFTSLHSFYIENWKNTFEEAQRNFVQSMAGYSLVCYLLNIKDRHNANILIDNQGHIIHIDFGFFLTTSPGGNMGFESAPFKLSEELIQVMGGTDSEMFAYYKILLLQGFLELRKHANSLLVTLQAMGGRVDSAACWTLMRRLMDLRKVAAGTD